MTILTTRIEQLSLKQVDAVVVENDSLLGHLRAGGHHCVVKAFPGVDTDIFFPSSAGWRRNGYLLSVCRLNEPRKGIDRMIRAYGRMVDADGSTPRLVLAGRGQLPQPILSLIVELGLEARVEVHPNVAQRNLPDLYRGASVFVQTSYEEGLGVAVLEAMASGLPVVSTETAGTKESVVDGTTGRLVPQHADVTHEIADGVHALLRDGGADFGARARKRCLDIFSSNVTIQKFTAIYDELLYRKHC